MVRDCPAYRRRESDLPEGLRVRGPRAQKAAADDKKGRTGVVAPGAAFVFLVMLFICAGNCAGDDLLSPGNPSLCFMRRVRIVNSFAPVLAGINQSLNTDGFVVAACCR